MPTKKPVIITLDVETSPYTVHSWQLWDATIGNDQIIHDATILACAIKELGKPGVRYRDTRTEKNPRNDRAVISWVHEELERADIVVTQNGKKFDIPRIYARMAHHGMSPPKPFLQVDTREVAKRVFKFASNKLEWLSKSLTDEQKLKHKKFPGNELWTECLRGNKAAWAEMKKYNIQDVRATEKLYLKLRPWMPNHPNTAIIVGKPSSCPKCGGVNLQSRGWAYTQVNRYQRFQCTACGGWTKSTKRAN